MALKIQTDPQLDLPQGWDESEQGLIDSFFEQRVPKVARTTCSATQCHEFTQGLMPGQEMVLVNNQGFHSYTLVCPDSKKIIQFRLKELNIEVADEAIKIYGDLVSRVVYHSDFNLPVYTMSLLPGVAHLWQEPSRDLFPLERELNTVSDLGKFIATSSHFPHSSVDCKDSSKTSSARATFKRLE